MSYIEKITLAKCLSEIHEDEDIIQLSHAIFPGTHCPLFGALMTSSYIEDLVVLVVGTQECTIYGKRFAMERQNHQDKVYSLVSTKQDITFGMQDKIRENVFELCRLENPKAILIISTCVVELIGEDVSAIAQQLEKEIDLPILVVKTEHFKCNSHLPGLRDVMTAMHQLMVPCEKENKLKKAVNLLGHRFDHFEESELALILARHEVKVMMSIPSKCSIDSLKEATRGTLNIVTDQTALPLAQLMAEKFDVPYICFERHMSPQTVMEQYSVLGEALDLDWEDEILALYEEVMRKMDGLRPLLQGKTFIYGNTPMKALEFSNFLIELGLSPVWIQLREWYDEDEGYRKQMLSKGFDPKISRIANIIPMRDVYDAYKPNFYFGHENPMELMRRNISQVTVDKEASFLGFQLIERVLNKLEGMVKANGHHVLSGRIM